MIQANIRTLCNVKVGAGKTWHPLLQRTKVRTSTTLPTMWNMTLALPCRHQVLYKWQEEEVCIGLAYSTQHMASEDIDQSHKEGGVGS